MHLVLGTIAAGMIRLVWGLHFSRDRDPQRPLPKWRFSLELAAAAVVFLTAHLGGFLSGINGT